MQNNDRHKNIVIAGQIVRKDEPDKIKRGKLIYRPIGGDEAVIKVYIVLNLWPRANGKYGIAVDRIMNLGSRAGWEDRCKARHLNSWCFSF